ncbi:A disintegrin and metalloproteinase with thrombospondin motifs 17-like isoform X1 [Ostrinia furnacalis]|uniref:A disintegrin and metalloproteinase with thrombospondin motifs 17-like isoform X1 n=2 Tax=Ostrinia furnacalis TaxID=93504 RepID=UPI001038A0ED|nr:A disintegrin and metalloproteinase with thrombospondin motifs 17-like isoform X1 [Ostrinia furnacalis]
MRLCLMLSVLLLHGSFSDGNRPKLRNSKESSVEYFTRQKSHLTIPIMMHFDKSLTDKLVKEHKIKTRKKLKDISRNILKEVETYFRHQSLNHSIHFNLLDTKFVKKNKLEMDENGSKYLKNYCTKQGHKKKESRRWWFSVLLTGMDLFYLDKNGREIRSSTGRSYMGGVCALDKSCTVLEWNPKNIGYLLTHEIGHSLGMSHDGAPHNDCRPHRYIMSNKYHPRYHPKTWSGCSKKDLQRFLLSRKAWCLR